MVKSNRKYGSFQLTREYLSLFETDTTTFLLLDGKGSIADLGKQFCLKLGFEKEDLISKDLEFILPFETGRKLFRNFLYQVQITNQCASIQCVMGHNKETFVSVSVTGMCLRNDLKQHVYTLCVVTDIICKEETTETQNGSQMLSVISHELRTPLAMVLSATWLAEKFALDGDLFTMQKYLKQIRSSIRNLTCILDEYLSADVLENGNANLHKELLNLPVLCEDVQAKMNTLTKEGQKICYNHSGNEMILQDKKALQHILFNLLSNALKYSPQYSIIEMLSVVGKESASISITDYGIGIPEEEQALIFSKFYRSENAADFEGTGLGLNISMKYAALIKGKIAVTSTLGKGSVFTVTFPVIA